MMYRRRLRDTPDQDELERMYPAPHDHRIYGYGHGLRVEMTIVLGKWMVDEFGVRSIADLSTGNAAIPKAIWANAKAYLGDFAPGYEYTGPIEQTITQIPEVDLFICSETIEHVDDPDDLLGQIVGKAKYLLLSTPIGEDDTGNPEHIWGWDVEAVEQMLGATGWEPMVHVELHIPDSYSYQIHTARRQP